MCILDDKSIIMEDVYIYSCSYSDYNVYLYTVYIYIYVYTLDYYVSLQFTLGTSPFIRNFSTADQHGNTPHRLAGPSRCRVVLSDFGLARCVGWAKVNLLYCKYRLIAPVIGGYHNPPVKLTVGTWKLDSWKLEWLCSFLWGRAIFSGGER